MNGLLTETPQSILYNPTDDSPEEPGNCEKYSSLNTPLVIKLSVCVTQSVRCIDGRVLKGTCQKKIQSKGRFTHETPF